MSTLQLSKTEENRKAVTAAMAALATGDTHPFGDLMSDDFVWQPMGSNNWAKAYEGKANVGEKLFRPLFAQFEGRNKTQAVNIIADGDYVIVEARGAATMKDGRPYNNRYCFVIRMEGGRMRELREYFDTALADRTLDASVL